MTREEYRNSNKDDAFVYWIESRLRKLGSTWGGSAFNADLYQLYAYTRRYGCTRSVLLYPFVPSLEPREFEVFDANGTPSGERVSVRHVRLHRNLQLEHERRALVQELEAVVREGLEWPSSGLVAAAAGVA